MSSSATPPSEWEDLVRAAAEARLQAYAPYSGFAVGAALKATDGRVFRGCNVENATYGLTLCAERAAVAAAACAGVRRFAALAIATGADEPAPPCGMCRQTLAEFADSLPIRSITTSGKALDFDLRELFPVPFRLRTDTELPI